MSEWINKPVSFKRTCESEMELLKFAKETPFTNVTKEIWQTIFEYTKGKPDILLVYNALNEIKKITCEHSMSEENHIAQNHMNLPKIMQDNLYEVAQNHTISHNVNPPLKTESPSNENDPPEGVLNPFLL